VQSLGGVEAVNAWLYLTPRDVVALLVLLVCLTGLEPESAKGLQADCLVNPARGFVSIRYVKRRAGTQAAKTLRVRDGGALHHPGALVRLIGRLTHRARQRADTTALWVHACRGVHPSFVGLNHMHRHVAGWLARHGLDRLLAAEGAAGLDLRRLRKTVKSQQYLKAAGVLVDFRSTTRRSRPGFARPSRWRWRPRSCSTTTACASTTVPNRCRRRRSTTA
jgi:hypothetical protein